MEEADIFTDKHTVEQAKAVRMQRAESNSKWQQKKTGKGSVKKTETLSFLDPPTSLPP